MKIFKLFPYAEYLFGVEGMSLSEAQRQKESNKNEAEKLLQNLVYDEQRAYAKTRISVSSSGETVTKNTLKNPHKIEDFDVLPKVAELYSQSAKLSIIKYIDEIRKEITNKPDSEFAAMYGINGVTLTPVQKLATSKIGGVDDYCKIDNVEILIQFANKELLNKIKDNIFNALEVEASAAVYGNQYANKDCLLRKIASSKNTLASKEIKLDNLLVIEDSEIAIDKNLFTVLEQEISEKYTELQKKRNNYIALIKNAARELQTKYDQEYEIELEKYHASKAQFQVEIQKLKSELFKELASLKVKSFS